MSTATKEQNDTPAKANAAAWLESIREMVGKLSREGAAKNFVKDKTANILWRMLWDCRVEAVDARSLDELRADVVEAITRKDIEPKGFEFDVEAARQTIEESVLSVEVRPDWYCPGADNDARKPAEFNILLTTGGPALRLIGELDEHGEPTKAWLEYQDWGTPWTHYYVEGAGDVLLQFAECFYFGE